MTKNNAWGRRSLSHYSSSTDSSLKESGAQLMSWSHLTWEMLHILLSFCLYAWHVLMYCKCCSGIKKCTQVFLALLVFQVHTAWADTIGERDSPMKQTFTNYWSSILRYQKEISTGCSLLLVAWMYFYNFPTNFATQTPYSTVFLKLVSQAYTALSNCF